MGVKFTNNAMTVSTTALSATDTVIALPATHGAKFPVLGADDWFPLTVVDTAGNLEIMRVTARSGDVLTVSRAQEGTAACAFNPGAILSHRATAASFEAVRTGAVDQTARDAAAGADGKAAAAQNTAASAQNTATSAQNTATAADAKAQQALDRPAPQPNPDTPQSDWGAIGTFILGLFHGTAYGGTVASGSQLSASNCNATGGSSVVGTWRATGFSSNTSSPPNTSKVTVWQRIA